MWSSLNCKICGLKESKKGGAWSHRRKYIEVNAKCDVTNATSPPLTECNNRGSARKLEPGAHRRVPRQFEASCILHTLDLATARDIH
jgi:hypothetical protein